MKAITPEELIAGALVLLLIHLPHAREIILQVRVQARLWAILPPDVRATFPDAPSSPGRVVLGSWRFFRAFKAYFRTPAASDPPEVARLKAELRNSSRREKWVGSIGLALVTTLAIGFLLLR